MASPPTVASVGAQHLPSNLGSSETPTTFKVPHHTGRWSVEEEAELLALVPQYVGRGKPDDWERIRANHKGAAGKRTATALKIRYKLLMKRKEEDVDASPPSASDMAVGGLDRAESPDYDFEYDPTFSIGGHVDASFVPGGSGQAASPPFEDQGVPSSSKAPSVETEPVLKIEESSPLADWTLAEDAVLLSTLFGDSSSVKSWNDVRSTSEKTFALVEGGVFRKSANECAERYYNALMEVRVGGNDFAQETVRAIETHTARCDELSQYAFGVPYAPSFPTTPFSPMKRQHQQQDRIVDLKPFQNIGTVPSTNSQPSGQAIPPFANRASPQLVKTGIVASDQTEVASHRRHSDIPGIASPATPNTAPRRQTLSPSFTFQIPPVQDTLFPSTFLPRPVPSPQSTPISLGGNLNHSSPVQPVLARVESNLALPIPSTSTSNLQRLFTPQDPIDLAKFPSPILQQAQASTSQQQKRQVVPSTSTRSQLETASSLPRSRVPPKPSRIEDKRPNPYPWKKVLERLEELGHLKSPPKKRRRHNRLSSSSDEDACGSTDEEFLDDEEEDEDLGEAAGEAAGEDAEEDEGEETGLGITMDEEELEDEYKDSDMQELLEERAREVLGEAYRAGHLGMSPAAYLEQERKARQSSKRGKGKGKGKENA